VPGLQTESGAASPAGPGPGAGKLAATEVGFPATLADDSAAGRVAPRIKITDFGLARHVIDTESLAMTAAGALLGTPHYMAPEQWTGRAIDARTDIYAMGATLFHLLAGRPPFAAETREALCAQHCNDSPPPLSALNPAVSEGVVRVVERALAKRPEERYLDAGAMLRDLESLLHGEPTGIPVHPLLPACDPRRALQFEFRWELESSPRQLWPLVTNTDRLDRAIGFPAVRYSNRFEPGRGVRTFVEGRKAGMVEVGQEHPYEWVEPRRMGVLREYSQGPFQWLVSVVELRPRPGGGTTLVHRLQFEPSSWTIRVGSRWGVGIGLRKRLESVYRRIDATVKGQAGRGVSPEVDPFEDPARLSGPRRQTAGAATGPAGRARRGCGGRRAAGRVPGPRVGPGDRPHPATRLGRAVSARSRPGRRRLPPRRARGPARAALGPALPGLSHLLPGHGHAPRDRRACPLRGLPP